MVMDVREKLVELLDEAEEWADCKCDELGCESCPADKMKGDCVQQLMVDRLIAHGVTVQEWIPVSEPPKKKGTYIVCTDKGGILLGHWYGKEWNVGGGAKKHLAYWMKKPQPPKGE